MQHQQRGMTMVGWMFVLAFFGVLAIAALNIIPAYLDFYSAKSIITDLKTDPSIKGKRPKEIKTMIGKRFRMNNLRNFNLRDDVKIKPKGSGSNSLDVVLDYEHRSKLMGNLDFVATFKHEVEITP